MQHSPKPRRRKRLILFVLCTVLSAALTLAATNLLMVAQTREAIYTLDTAQDRNADCILVLGCGLRQDGTPGRQLCQRLDAGIAAYEQGIAPKLLMSGDHGRVAYDEVNAMKDYAMARGVPGEDIFMDHAGFSTYESMYRAKQIFGCERVAVVTQTYHLYRSIYNARAMEMQAIGIACDGANPVRSHMNGAREVLARAKDALWCVFKPAPTCLGQSIPIFGNGDVTNDRT